MSCGKEEVEHMRRKSDHPIFTQYGVGARNSSEQDEGQDLRLLVKVSQDIIVLPQTEYSVQASLKAFSWHDIVRNFQNKFRAFRRAGAKTPRHYLMPPSFERCFPMNIRPHRRNESRRQAIKSPRIFQLFAPSI